jgi:hypothetical protein
MIHGFITATADCHRIRGRGGFPSRDIRFVQTVAYAFYPQTTREYRARRNGRASRKQTREALSYLSNILHGLHAELLSNRRRDIGCRVFAQGE